MNKYSIVLFDMDGTLTPSRESIDQDMIDTLLILSKKVKIGIVTGSGFDYIQEQCNDLLNDNSINKKNLAIFNYSFREYQKEGGINNLCIVSSKSG